jgi:hypothetical protein
MSIPASKRKALGYPTDNDNANWIDEAYHRMVRQAESTINKNIERYKRAISVTVEYEVIMAKRELEAGRQNAFKHHESIAEVYTSLLQKLEEKNQSSSEYSRSM